MFENISMAIESLRSNKMRSFLTMLGIIIGIGAVIGIISLGDGLTNMMDDQMSSMGANNVSVNLQGKKESFTAEDAMSSAGSPEEKDQMTMKQIEGMTEEFKDEIDAIDISGYSNSLSSYQAKVGSNYANVTIQGANPGYAAVKDLKMEKGHFINDSEMDAQRRVAVVSDRLVSALYGSEEPLGKTVRAYGSQGTLEFSIIGVYKYEENALMMSSTGVSEKDKVTDLYVPITTFKTNWGTSKNYDYISIKIKTGVDLNTVTDQISAYWKKQYSSNNEWTAAASNMKSIVDEASQSMGIMKTVLSIIAGISLLVGGIGVMNIMLVSVTERTHEIGIRKALGAQDTQIMIQFVTEAMILCTVGGIIGIILGIGLGTVGSNLIASMMSVESSGGSFNPTVIAGTLAFSMFIGVFFGLYPARKAAKLDPIDALRYE